jgi:hypothetical protein
MAMYLLLMVQEEPVRIWCARTGRTAAWPGSPRTPGTGDRDDQCTATLLSASNSRHRSKSQPFELPVPCPPPNVTDALPGEAQELGTQALCWLSPG